MARTAVSWMLPTFIDSPDSTNSTRTDLTDLTLSRSVQSHLLDSSCLFHICGTCFSLFFPLESLGFPIDPGINSWISWDQLQIHIPNCTCDMSVTEMRGFRSQGGGETGAGDPLHGFSWNIVQYQETGLVKTTKESLCAVNAANI